ncbi:MAG: GNAT family N-acetyltransferase [Eubacteriales bacterium]
MEPIIKVFDALPKDAEKIREEVFVLEQGFSEEFDAIDSVALHIVAYDNGSAVGTCRLFAGNEEGTYIIGRIAVTADYRGKGLGRYLLDQAEKIALRKGAARVELHAQCRAEAFYKKCGYESFGDIDYEEYCPHIRMRKIINE